MINGQVQPGSDATSNFDGGMLGGVTVWGSSGDIGYQWYQVWEYRPGNSGGPVRHDPDNPDGRGGRPQPTEDKNGNQVLIHGKIVTVRIPVPGMPTVRHSINLKIQEGKLENVTSVMSGLPGVNKYEQMDWVFQQKVEDHYFFDLVFRLDQDITIAGVGLFIAGEPIHARGYYREDADEAYVLYTR